MKRERALFFFSVLFCLLAGLLYAWGPPAWFDDFPFAAGLRFLLSLKVYFLCCAVFFALRVISFPKKARHAFLWAFCLSFAAIPAFSLLVILDSPIQVLQSMTAWMDVALWLAVTLLAINASAPDIFLTSVLFFITGILLLVPAIPSIATIAARFILLSIFTIKSLQAHDPSDGTSVGERADFLEAAERFALSPRETEVLSLLVTGKTNAEIGKTLFISLSTVKTHIASIFGKMGARNRIEASAKCKKT